MARLKLKQLLSNMSYDPQLNQLSISGSQDPAVVISGSLFVTGSLTPGTVTIAGVDTFGDSGSFDSIDLGEY